MKAVVCTRYGPPEVLRLTEIETPEPKDNEILVNIHATSVTAADFRVRSFTVPLSFWVMARLALGMFRPRQAVLGAEFAGDVVAVGKNVTEYKPGDAVFGTTGHHFGAYAEYICVEEDGQEVEMAKKPANLTYREAVAVPFGGISALHFLRAANIERGQRVLIYGASGSLGTYAVQLAKYYGADVTGVCSTANLELVKSLGADNVVDYTKENFAKRGETYDVIFEAVGKAAYGDCIRALKADGVLLHAVAAPGISARMLWTSMTSRKTLIGGGPSHGDDNLIFLKGLIEANEIRPVIDRVYPLEQIVEAHRYVDLGHKKGNVVILVSQEGNA